MSSSGRSPFDAGSPTARRGTSPDGQGDDVWGYVPVTVVFVVFFSGLFTVLGVRPFVITGSDFVLWEFQNLLQTHLFSMFMHQGMRHFLLNAMLLVLFGGALTVLSSNAHLAAVMTASHVAGSVFVEVTESVAGIGASLAVAGVVAATVVRTVALFADRTDAGAAERVLGGAFAAAVIVVFAATSVTGTLFLRITDHHLGGWVAGGVVETLWVLWIARTRG